MGGAQELGEWVREAFGLGDGPATTRLVGRGAEGRVFRLEVQGARFALKQPFGAVDERDVVREAAHLDHFARAGVEVPVHRADPSGRYVLPVPERLGGGLVRLTRWIEGEPVHDLADVADLAAPLGTLLGTLHAAAPPAPPDPGRWYTTAPDDAAWDDLVTLSTRTPWGEALAGRLADLRQHGALVRAAGPPPGPLVIGHRDLHPENVLRSPGGTLRALDWEEAGPVDPGRELAKVLVQWHVDGDAVDTDAVRETVGAYRAAGGRGAVTGTDDFAMVLSTEPNFLAVQLRAALDPAAAADHRQHAVAEIEESLRYLPTPAALERVLAAAAGR